MVKNLKLLTMLCCGAIIALLVYSRASRSDFLVSHDGSGVSGESASSLMREESLSVKQSPRGLNTIEVSQNDRQAFFQVSPEATSPVIIKEAAGAPGDLADWNLTFSDEFDGKSLDPEKWATEYGFDTDCIVDNPPPPGIRTYCNRSNNDEKEWYTDESQSVKDGVLRLEASINDCLGDGLPDRNYGP